MFTIWNWDRRIGTLHFIEAFTKFHRISSNHISSEFHRNFIGISSNFIELHRTSSLHRKFIESVRGSSRVFHVFIELHRKVLQKVSGVHRTGFLFIESVRGSSQVHRIVHRRFIESVRGSSRGSSSVFSVHRERQGFIDVFIDGFSSSKCSSEVSGVHQSVHISSNFIETMSGVHRNFIETSSKHKISSKASSKCSSLFIDFIEIVSGVHRTKKRDFIETSSNFIETVSGVHRTFIGGVYIFHQISSKQRQGFIVLFIDLFNKLLLGEEL